MSDWPRVTHPKPCRSSWPLDSPGPRLVCGALFLDCFCPSFRKLTSSLVPVVPHILPGVLGVLLPQCLYMHEIRLREKGKQACGAA